MKKKTTHGWGRGLLVIALIALTAGIACADGKKTAEGRLKVLYWNIQNGMWSGQPDNYDKFVEWVKAYDPDICIWAEAQTIYLDGTDTPAPAEEHFLTDGWGELAARYGHGNWAKGGHRDSYPQVITSKYPIEVVEQIVGAQPDSVVSHGSGWFRIESDGHTLNLVTAHLWPQAYGFGVRGQADRDASRANNDGDKFRRREIEYICTHTIGSAPDAAGQLWLMAGDFNSHSRIDNAVYNHPEESTRFLTQDYIAQQTPYLDIIAEKYPGEFKTTTYRQSRIDYVYCTPALYDLMVTAEIVVDDYTKPTDDSNISNFKHPSDHLPIVAEFNYK